MPELEVSSTARVIKRLRDFETHYGGNGNGSTNNDTAFASMVADTLDYDRIVFRPGAVYAHNNYWKLDTKHHVTIDGWNSRIKGTVSGGTSAAWFTNCDQLQVNGLTHEVTATARRNNFDGYCWCFTECTELELNSITSLGSEGASMYFWGCENFVARMPYTEGSKADGIHFTGPCKDGQVFHPVIVRAADDGLACVSYAADSAPVTNLTVHSPRFMYQSSGRGLTIVGGTNVHYRDVYGYMSRAAGIMIAIEGPPPNVNFTTKGISNCGIHGGRLLYCNQAAASEGHGSVLVLNQRPSSSGVTMDNVVVEGLDVQDTGKTSISPFQVKNDGQTTAVMTNVHLRHNWVNGQRAANAVSIESGITLATNDVQEGGVWASFG